MNSVDTKKIVLECIQNYLETHDIEADLNDNSALIGSQAIVDSMGLVNIIVDIESELLNYDIEVSLVSEKAMSRKISPFRSITALVALINEQLNEASSCRVLSQ